MHPYNPYEFAAFQGHIPNVCNRKRLHPYSPYTFAAFHGRIPDVCKKIRTTFAFARDDRLLIGPVWKTCRTEYGPRPGASLHNQAKDFLEDKIGY